MCWWPGLHPGSHWGSLQRSPKLPNWIWWKGRGWKDRGGDKGGKGGRGEKGGGREGDRGEERGNGGGPNQVREEMDARDACSMILTTVMRARLLLVQVFEHEAMVRVMAGASPARSFQRHPSSTLRRRHRQLSAPVTADRIKNAVLGT